MMLDGQRANNLRFCTNCGNPISESSAFCGCCGARVGDSLTQNEDRYVEKTIIIEREKKLISSAIVFEIIVDDNMVKTLRNGEKTEFKVDGSRTHSLFINSRNTSMIAVNNGYGATTAFSNELCSQVIEIPMGTNPIKYFLTIKMHFSHSEIIINEVR